MIRCSIREATYVRTADGQMERITVKWGIKEGGGFEKGGFGVITESGKRVSMYEAHSYYKEEEQRRDCVIAPLVRKGEHL